MGDNQLSILIQARIDEASTKTMQDQLDTLAKNLKSVKISLDLGDVKAQFAKMFQEIEKESQKQKLSSGIKVSNSSNQTFTGTQEEALRKAVVHANALSDNLQEVRNVVKDLGNLTSLKEEFSSADGSLVKMKARVEEVNGTLRQVKDIDVFKTINAETGEVEYQMGRVAVQTKEFGMTLEELQKAGKGNPYQNLYESLVQFTSGGQNATKVANDLHNAIYTKEGNERSFFTKLDTSVQKEYLSALQQARAQEAEMDKLHYQALQMNKQQDNAKMDALHKEALALNKAYDNQKKADAKTAEAIDKAHYQALQEEARRNTAKMDAIHAEALAENKRRNKEAEALDKAHKEALAMNSKMDVKQSTQQANVDFFKKQMNQSINNLLATNTVDTSRIDALRASMEQLDGKTQNVAQRMKELNAEFKDIARDSIQVTTASSNMGLLEKEIISTTEQFRLGEIEIQEYANRLKDLMFDSQGNLSNAFKNNVDLSSQIQYLNTYRNIQAQVTKEEQQQAVQAQQKQTFYKQIEEQLKKIENIVSNTSKYDSNQYSTLVRDYNQLRSAVENGNMSLTEARSRFQELGIEMREFQQETRNANATTGKFFNTLKMMVGIYSLYDVFNLGKRAIRDMVEQVRTLDSALVELNKVSDLSDSQLNAYVNTAFKVSESVGRLGSDVINATSDFVQMGYSIEESAKLAENALMYVNVGDLGSVDDATSAMISTMKAFGIEANNSLTIIDKINNMSNNFAISAEGIGSGLQRASSALASANNDIDETLAMMAVGNQVIQDPDTLANGLKTISMRIRGLSEDGEELESNMEEVFASYANGVKVLNDDGSFRSTFDILNDLGKEWDNLSDKQQAYLAETVAGKHRANIFLALMENAEDLDKALATSQNSANSAIEENERYMDSIAGKVSQMQSAWQSLASTTINSEFVKGIVDMTTGLIKLTDACGGLIPVIIGLATAFALLKLAPVANMIGNLTLGIMSSIPIFASATGAVMAFNTALTFGVGGAIVASIMAIGAGIKYVSTMSERAEERVTELKNSISELGSEKETVQELADTYDDLKDRVMPTIEEQEKLTSTMNELKTLVPSLNGYYKENGDFVITSTEALNDYIESKKEEIQLEREKLALEAEGQMGGISEKIEEQVALNAEAERYLELLKKQSDGTWTGDESDEFERLGAVWLEAKYAQKQIEDGTKAISESLVEYREKLTDIMVASEDWMGLTEEQRDAIKELVAESDYSFLAGIYDDATNDVQGYILKLLELNSVQNIIAKNAEQGSKKLSQYAYVAKDLENTTKAFNDITDEIGDLNSVLDDLNNGNGLTASSVEKIINTYPQLLKHINNEASLREAIAQAMDEQKNAQQKAYNDMLSASDDYYRDTILANENWKKTTEANVEALFKSLGIAYKADLESYTNMEKAKAGVTQDLINNLGTSWEQFFDSMSGQFKKMDFDTVFSELNGVQQQLLGGNPWAKNKNEQIYNNVQSSAETYWTAQRDKFLKAKEDIDKMFDYEFDPVSIELGGSTKSASKDSSSSKPKASYVASIYQEIVDEILKGGEDIEKAMELADAKLTNAELVGNTALEEALKADLLSMQTSLRDKQAMMAKELETQMAEMAKILSNTGLFGGYDLSNLTDKQMAEVIQKLEKQINSATLAENDTEVERLENLKSIIEDVGGVYLSTIEQRRELSKVWWEEENERIEMLMEKIDDLYAEAKKKIDDSNRDIELQQILLEEGSKEYMELEKKKYQNVLALQEEARQALKKIKEQDKNLESEMAQEYLEIWYDAEKEKREMIKSFAEQAMKDKKEEIEQQTKDLTEAQEALNDLLEATIKLIKQELNDKKEALEEEIDAYEELINKKKENLKADKQARDDAKELKEKQNNVAKIEAQIAELQFDTSAQATAKRLELEEQLAEAREELEDFQYDQSIEKQEEALDEELERFKETKEKEIKEIEDFLSKEGNLRAEALKLIESGNKELYDKLIQWNQDYGTGVSEDITNAWDLAHDAMESYNGGQMNVLETLSKITAEMERLNDLSENMKVEDFIDDSDGGMMGDIQDNPDTPSENHGNTISEEEAKKQEQLNQQKYLHEQAKKAKAEGNDALLRWVQAERKKWGLDPTSGAITSEGVVPADVWATAKKKYNIYHTGGFVGDLASNEEFAKLLKGEYVATEQQMQQFMNKTLPSITGIQSPTQSLNFENLINLRVDGNLDSSILPELESIIEKSINGAIGKINETMISRGFRRTGMSLGI